MPPHQVTTDLDVLARQTLLDFLKEESEEQDVTVLFSTHIFDGLNQWGTHVTHVSDGRVLLNSRLSDIGKSYGYQKRRFRSDGTKYTFFCPVLICDDSWRLIRMFA
jgi:ABC-type uncharacterized transport system ATPase subunit